MPTVQWVGIHNNILGNDNKTNIEPGILTIRNLSIEDSGVYGCIAENSYGKISHSITLQVQGKQSRRHKLVTEFFFTRVNFCPDRYRIALFENRLERIRHDRRRQFGDVKM